MVLMEEKQWEGMLVDIETAFLEGKIDTEVFVNLPQGWEKVEDFESDDCGRLNAALYGLVQAARVFYDKVREIHVKKLGFESCMGDGCIFKRDELVIGIYVDDSFVIGKKERISEYMDELKIEFTIKETRKIDEFVGVQFEWRNDRVKLHQRYISEKLIKQMRGEIEKVIEYKTPAIPHVGIQKPEELEATISEEKQNIYRSCVGTFLYLTKHSRPDLSNCVRELSKVNASSTEGNYKQLLREIKYVEQTKEKGLWFNNGEVKEGWKLTCFVDSDWEGDKSSRNSVTGWVIFLNECAIGWGSRGQKCVSLSSSEAEYVGITEISKDILYIRNLLEFLGRKVLELPIVVQCDNTGAIYLTGNRESRRTKYMDTKYHFVREYVEDGILKVIFVPTGENKADPYTKNVSECDSVRHFDYLTQ